MSGTDVYTAGYTIASDKSIATIWKNGVAQKLSDGTKTTVIYDIFVHNNNVYAVGNEKNGSLKTARLWKNGVLQSLPVSGTVSSGASSVFVK